MRFDLRWRWRWPAPGCWRRRRRPKVTVVGWPGGPEETALRAVTEIYNAKPEVTDDEQGRADLLLARRLLGQAAGRPRRRARTPSTPICSRPTRSAATRRSWSRSSSPTRRRRCTAPAVLKTMQFDGKQYGVPTDLSLHFLYYRKDLIDALLADPAAQAKYTDDRRDAPREEADAEGAGRLDLGRLRGHRALLHQGDQSRTARRATAPCCR